MKHVRVISLSALLVACSSIGLEGENVTPGKSDKGDDPSVEGDAGVGGNDEQGDEEGSNDPAQAGSEQEVADDAAPESTIVSSEEALDALIAQGSADGQAIGGVTLRLIDAPVEADAVNVTFCGVQVHMLVSGEQSARPVDAGAGVGDRAEPAPPPEETRGEKDPMMGGEPAGSAPVRETTPNEGQTPPPDGLVPPDRTAPEGTAPADMAPPEGDTRPPALEPKTDEMRPLPPEGEVPPPEERPLEELPEDQPGMVMDAGSVVDERPEPKPVPSTEMAPPPPDRAPMGDAGAPLPDGTRPSGVVTDTPPGHWLGVGETCVSVDLLALQDGVFEELGFAALPIGNYGQIRLNLVDAEVVVDGVAHALVVPGGPSGDEGGLKIEGGFTVEDGEVTTLTVDFDAARSVEQTERGEYLLKPVIFLAGTERRVVRPPQQPGEPKVDGEVRDPMQGEPTKPAEPGREPSSTDVPPDASGAPSKPVDSPQPEAPRPTDDRKPVDDQPPSDEPAPAVSERPDGMAPPPGSVPPSDMPPPSGTVVPMDEQRPPSPEDETPREPSDTQPPPPPMGSARPATSAELPPPPAQG